MVKKKGGVESLSWQLKLPVASYRESSFARFAFLKKVLPG
jgi:hypothetical protein